MKKFLLPALAALMALASCQQPQKSGFAIVIDPQSYEEAKTEIDRYQQVVANRGLHPILVIDQWGVPDSIRAKLIELYNAKENPIEGAVFIGDIPVPMVRDAQHMTTALKQDQNSELFTRDEFSVPTDRFYDDFDLEWEFQGTEEAFPGWFFYSLKANCPQQLEPDIYSGRIMPRSNERGDKYEKLRRYMQRVNEADAQDNVLDQLLFFAGDGFISESMDARIDEKAEYYDDFPWLKQSQQQTIEFIDHKRENFIKKRVTTEMQRSDLDYAVMHHHGDSEIQYLSNMPMGKDFDESINILKVYLRDMMREGKERNMDKAEVMRRCRNFIDPYLPEQWFDHAFDPETLASDEEFEAQVNLIVEEFDNYHPQCRFVSLDACYNGSFHKNASIQECYLFGEGNGTLNVLANSVNVLQDKWVNKHVGLLGFGVRAGYMAKLNPYLEQHLFGDPTLTFTPGASLDFDLNGELAKKDNTQFWLKQLNSEYPAIQILAIDRVSCGGNYSDLIFGLFKTSPSGIVRLAAMQALSKYNDENFVQCVALALNDSHEMTQRFASNYVGRMGHDELIPEVVRLACKNNTSERIEYDLGNSLRCFDSTKVMEYFEEYSKTLSFYNESDSTVELVRNALKVFTTQMYGECHDRLFNETYAPKTHISAIRMLRNTNLHLMVPELLNALSEPSEDVKFQVTLMEALGWFNYSCKIDDIVAKAKELAVDERFDPAVRNEALRTVNRLTQSVWKMAE